MKNIVKLLVLALAVTGVTLAFASCGCSHEEEIIPAVEATCTAEGATEGKKCTKCGEITVAPETVEKKDHSPANAKKEPATCTEAGHEAGVYCSVCETVISGMAEIAPAHKPMDVDEIPATCTAVGTAAGKRCSVCKEALEGFEEIAKLPHTLYDVERIEPGCIKAGSEAGKQCENCSYSEGLEPISPLGHTEVNVEAKAPTCTEAGVEAGVKCSTCLNIVSGCSVLPATGHTHGELTTISDPLPGVAGKASSVCTVCNLPIEVEIPALPGAFYTFEDGRMPTTGDSSASASVTIEEDASGNHYLQYTMLEGSAAEGYLGWEAVGLGNLREDNCFVISTKIRWGSVVGNNYSDKWAANLRITTELKRNDKYAAGYNFNIKEDVIDVGPADSKFYFEKDVWYDLEYRISKKPGENRLLITITINGNVTYSGESGVNGEFNFGNAIVGVGFKTKNQGSYKEFNISFDDMKLVELPLETTGGEESGTEGTTSGTEGTTSGTEA